jgi:TatD DNase family protein
MKLFDTHCHLQDPKFDDAGAVAGRAVDRGVAWMLVCGYDLPSSERAVAMAARSPALLPAVGVHPHDANDVSDEVLASIEALAADQRVVAVGEIGLDFYRDLSPRDTQREVLAAQLDMAARLRKPVSVHSRGAEDELFELLAAYAEKSPLGRAGRPGVMHCFGGTLEQARRYVELGFLVSVPCSVTYPANDEGRRVASGLPLEALVVETDSPYLPPQGLRGKRNEPANVGAAVEAVAAARGARVDEVAAATTANAGRVFGIDVRQEVIAG